jgi:hypothetical protein
MLPDWVPFALTALATISGVSYWGGRLARALEGIEHTIGKMAARQDETEKHVGAHDSRLARLEALQEQQS